MLKIKSYLYFIGLLLLFSLFYSCFLFPSKKSTSNNKSCPDITYIYPFKNGGTYIKANDDSSIITFLLLKYRGINPTMVVRFRESMWGGGMV